METVSHAATRRTIVNAARFADCAECHGDGRGQYVHGDQLRPCVTDCAACHGSGIARCPECLDAPTFTAGAPCLVCAAERAADVWRWGGFAPVPPPTLPGGLPPSDDLVDRVVQAAFRVSTRTGEMLAAGVRAHGLLGTMLVDEDPPLAGPVIKTCGCGVAYERAAWEQLQPAGGDERALRWFDGTGWLEMRLCRACRSTLAIELPAPSADDAELLGDGVSEDRP